MYLRYYLYKQYISYLICYILFQLYFRIIEKIILIFSLLHIQW